MASIKRLAKTIHDLRSIAARKTLAPPPSLRRPHHHHHHHQLSYNSFNHHIHTSASGGHKSGSAPEISALCYLPAVVGGLFGVGALTKNVVYADANEDNAKTPSPPEPHSAYVDLEAIAKKERVRLEELLKSKGMNYGSYPKFTVAVKGQTVTIKFHLPPTSDFALLISKLVSRLGVKVEEHGTGSDMTVRAWDSAVAWQITLSRPKMQKEAAGDQGNTTANAHEANAHEGDLNILMFRSTISSDKPEIEFIKRGSFSSDELEALVSVLQLAAPNRVRGDTTSTAEKSVSSLEAMGVKIYGINEANLESSKKEISWDNIAGYSEQKREIEDTILLALHSPEVYDEIARGTRCKFETNRPRAVLFEGPPGTGKTSCARVIASQSGVPLLYVPLEVIMSKYFGESERLLGKVFSLANEISNGAIIFLDEVDSFATSRDSETHEATRRILSVILRQIDGFEQEKKVVVIAATNRKQDLDPALISRFDSMITFGLPDQQTRQEITAQYAKHLTKAELAQLSTALEEMSGRDIREVCQQAERHWASKIIRGQAPKTEDSASLPPLEEYIESATNRRKVLVDVSDQNQNSPKPSKKPRLDFA